MIELGLLEYWMDIYTAKANLRLKRCIETIKQPYNVLVVIWIDDVVSTMWQAFLKSIVGVGVFCIDVA